MTTRMLGSIGTLAALASAWTLMSVPASGQGKSASAPPLVVTAFGGIL